MFMSALPPIFAALSDPNRFAIVERLMSEGELSAGEISYAFDISAPAISRHLSVLHDAGLVRRRAMRQQRLYSVEPGAIRKVSDWTLDHRAFWEASLTRLEAALQEENP